MNSEQRDISTGIVAMVTAIEGEDPIFSNAAKRTKGTKRNNSRKALGEKDK